MRLLFLIIIHDQEIYTGSMVHSGREKTLRHVQSKSRALALEMNEV